MNRLLLSSEEGQDQNVNDTPLRGDRPRFRRTEPLISINPVILRKWFPPSTPQTAISESPERCCTPKLSDPDGTKKIQVRLNLLTPKQIYPGDRFIPSRRSYSFQAAYYLLRKQSDNLENMNQIDFCKQIDLLEVTYRREAMHTMMIKQEVIPGLNQNKVLRGPGLKNTTAQFPEFEKKGEWKCIPRKKPLIGSIEKMLSMPDSESDIARQIDWSCIDVIGMGSQDGLTIYDNSGDILATWHEERDRPTAVKWSNDGLKLACTFLNSMILKLYSLLKQMSLWSVACGCVGFTMDCCNNLCVCWSRDDRQIVIGCYGTISVYASGNGELVRSRRVHPARILTLSFSPNFKYLVSTAQDRIVRIFTWPDVISCYDIEFFRSIKAVAWHPEKSGLLCIGGMYDASLSLWNINTSEMMDHLSAKPDGCVENLAWNKLSGELVVHWSYTEGDKRYSAIPILASFGRIVDALPLDKEAQLSFLKFNATYERLVTYHNDILSIWNFFGNEGPPQRRCVPLYNTKKKKGISHNSIR